jgi:hypothetical protein
MLESLKFEIGGFPGIFIKLNIRVKDGIVYYEIKTAIDDEPFIKDFLSLEDSKDWLYKLSLIHINKWNKKYHDNDICDGEQWELEYKLKSTKKLVIYGSNDYPDNWYQLARLVNIFVPNEKIINSINISAIEFKLHNKQNIITMPQYPGSTIEKDTKKYENLIIDGIEDKIYYTRTDCRSCTIKNEYSFDKGYLSDYILSNCGSYFIDPFEEEKKEYIEPYVEVIVTHQTLIKEKYTYNYNRGELPIFWDDLILSISSFIKKHNSIGDLFNPEVYNHGIRENEYVYCKVKFDDSHKTYYYLSDDYSIRIGDSVEVAVGNDNYFKEATVETVEYYDKEKVPYPLEKMRKILSII